MAKLYAELTSDKGGRVAGKSGDNVIRLNITKENKQILELEINLIKDYLYVSTYGEHAQCIEQSVSELTNKS